MAFHTPTIENRPMLRSTISKRHLRTSRSAARRKGRMRLGTTTVEFAVVAPVMILFTIGAMQLFRFYSVANSTELAIMEGARRGILSTSSEAEASSAAEDYLDRAGLHNTSVSVLRETNPAGQMHLTISATTPLSGNGFLAPPGQQLSIRRECKIRCESSN